MTLVLVVPYRNDLEPVNGFCDSRRSLELLLQRGLGSSSMSTYARPSFTKEGTRAPPLSPSVISQSDNRLGGSEPISGGH